MVGRKGGWHEAPYLPISRMEERPQCLSRFAVDGLEIAMVPGLKTRDPDAVMRLG